MSIPSSAGDHVDCDVVPSKSSKKRRDFPFLNVNGDAIQDKFINEITTEDGGLVWDYRQEDSVTLSQLEIGLRKVLRERIVQEDCVVVVEVHGGASCRLCAFDTYTMK